MVDTVVDMTGLEKATVLMMSLGQDACGEIMKHLSPEQREILGAQIISMRPVRTVTQQRVFDEASKMVRLGAREDSARRDTPVAKCESGAFETSRVPEEPPLKWLDRLAPEVVADLLQSERPQNVALVISRLSPQTAAGVLGILDEKLRNQAAHRLATIRSVADEAIAAIDQAMQKRLEKANNSTVPQRELPETPEDLVFLPDAQLREVVSRMSVNALRLVLSIASEDLRSAILANAPDDVAEQLRSPSSSAERPRVRDVELAQRSIVDEAIAVATSCSTAGAAT